MNTKTSPLLTVVFPIIALFASNAAAQVKENAATSAQPPSPKDEEVILMNVFDVTSDRDAGYISTNAEGATRLNAPIADIPQNIVVFNEEFLRDIMAENIADVVLYDPTVTAFGGGDSFSMRGMGGAAAPGVGANFLNGFEQSGGFGSQTLVNTQRMEVLKGPNAVLYGQGAFGGTISRTSKKPEGKTATWMRFTTDDSGYYRYQIDTQAPLIKKKLAYRLNALGGKGDTWIGSSRRDIAISPAFRWHIARRTELLGEYTYHYQRTGLTNYEAVLRDGDPLHITVDGVRYPFDPFRPMGELDDYRVLKNHITYAEFRHEFSRHVHFRVLFNSENRETHNFETLPEAMYYSDVTGEPLVSRYYRDWVITNDNHRVRVEVPLYDVKTWFIKHKIIVGFGWEHMEQDSVRWQTSYYRPTGMSPVPGQPITGTWPTFNPDLHLAPANVLTHVPGHVGWTKENLPRLFDNTLQTTQIQSYYISDLMSLLDDRVFVQFGLRYVDIRRSDNRRGTIFNKFANSDFDAGSVYLDVFKEHPLTHSAGLVWHLKKNKAWTLYANNNASFVPNYRLEYPNGPRLKSMTGNQYEGGVKYVYRDKFHATLSYFDIVQRNVPGLKMVEYVDSNGVPQREQRNVTLDGLHSNGIELNFNTNIGGWQVLGGYAYTDCINMEVQTDDYSGLTYDKRHYRTPRHAFSALTTYKIRHGVAKGLQFTLGFQWRDSMLAQYVMPDTQIRYEPKFTVPSFLNINADVAYAFKVGKLRITAQLSIRNVTDEMNALASYNVRVSWATPRSVNFGLSVSF